MNARFLSLVSITTLAVVAWAPFAPAQTDADAGLSQINWPDTPAGSWAKAYFEAYNADGEDALRPFIKEHFSETYLNETPVKEVADGFFKTRGMIHKLEPRSATPDGDFHVDVVARAVVNSRPIAWLKVTIQLSPEPPHDVANMVIGPGPTPEERKPKDYLDWKDLGDLLEQVRRDSGAPAIAVAVVRNGELIEKAVTGVRRIGRPEPVQIDDRYHLGSVTKSFTATMIGKLVEQRTLRWDTTLGEVLHDIPMRAEYRSVTLEQLLQHRGGIPSMPSSGAFANGIPDDSGGSARDARAVLVKQILSENASILGTYKYSNSGYVVAGYMAERAAKQPWEELMRTLVFEPLKLRSAGFGWPATPERPDQPLGHLGIPPDLTAQEAGGSLLGDGDYFGPAGNVHCGIEDLARFAAFHLKGLKGHDGALKAETVRRLHTPAPGEHYAGGWVVKEIEPGKYVHSHEGTAGSFFAKVQLYPESDLAIVALANCGPAAGPFFRKMTQAIYRRSPQTADAPKNH
jgi:CubicO group peptidase (beta-lactamase class C family)